MQLGVAFCEVLSVEEKPGLTWPENDGFDQMQRDSSLCLHVGESAQD